MPAATDQLGQDVGGVADQRHRAADAVAAPAVDHGHRLVERVGQLVDVGDVQAAAGAGLVDLDHQRRSAVHRDRQRLGAAHAAQAGGERGRPGEGAAEMLARRLGEGLVGALDDSLRGDVDPRAGGHLAVHREALALQLAEVLPGRPVRHEVGVGDEDAGRIGRGAEDADGLAGLDEQRLVVLEALKLRDDRVEGLPGARRPPGAAVHDEVVRILGHLGVEVVHEHPQRRLLLPALAGERRAARSAHRARAAPRFDGRHARHCTVEVVAFGGMVSYAWASRNATENPKTVARPTVSPPYSKASGIIESASMVRIAPPANA